MTKIQIHRYCGKERLPGGERLWLRIARSASFTGSISVFGYGTGGRPGQEQGRAYVSESSACGATLGDWTPGHIRVWLPCRGCAAVEFDSDFDLDEHHETPLAVLAHELGHHLQYVKSRGYVSDALEEAVASRYGRWLLRGAIR